MTQASTAGLGAGDLQLRQLAAFAEISKSAEARLKHSLELLSFQIGQPLCEEEAIPARVLLLIQGECRLLGKEQGQFATLARMGPGSFVGLASLLRAEGCETVTAATDLVAAAIPDQLVVELYSQEQSFRNWCDRQLWPAELAALLVKMLSTNATSDGSTRNKLGPLMQQAALLPAQAVNDPEFLKAAAEGRSLFLASANSSGSLGDAINLDSPIPTPKPPFALRIISLPKRLPGAVEPTKSTDAKSISAQAAPNCPAAATFNLAKLTRWQASS